MGGGGGVEVDVLGSVDAYYYYLNNTIIFLVASKSTVRRFPNLKEKCEIISIPNVIDNFFIRKIFKGRVFSFLCTLFVPIYVSFKLRISNYICSEYFLSVYLNSSGGALFRIFMPILKLKLIQANLSLTGMPSFLLNTKSYWRKIESRMIFLLWKNITLGKYNYIYCLSKKTREACLQKFGSNKKIKSKFVYLPNPCFSNKRLEKIKHISRLVKQKYKANNKNKSSLKLLLVGRLSYQKNQSLAIYVMNNILTYNLKFKPHLDLIGDGEDKEKLIKLIKKVKSSNTINIKPFNKNILDQISHYDLILCTSLWEDSSVFLNEVLSVGMPLIAPKMLHGLEDYSQNPLVSDLFFNSYSSDQIIKKIILFYEKRDFYRKAFITMSDKKHSLHTSQNYYKLTKKYLGLENY